MRVYEVYVSVSVYVCMYVYCVGGVLCGAHMYIGTVLCVWCVTVCACVCTCMLACARGVCHCVCVCLHVMVCRFDGGNHGEFWCTLCMCIECTYAWVAVFMQVWLCPVSVCVAYVVVCSFMYT